MPLRLALSALLAALVLAAGAAPAAAKSCSPPAYPGSGYFTSLLVKNTTCSTGRNVALAHHRCRTEDGRTGKCRRRVLRHRCRETGRNVTSTELNARVSCRRGARRVTFTFQQNL